MWFVTWLACGGEAVPTEPPPAPAAAPVADPHASHSTHMAQMAAMRDTLRAELGDAYDAPVPGLDAANGETGKVLYAAHCLTCHGASGKGDGAGGVGLSPAPSDLTDAFHSRYYSDAGRVRVIQKGSAGTAMVGFEGVLDGRQILDVYAYVRTFR